MDREWIRDKLLRAGTEVTDESNDECDAVWLTIPRPSVDVLADTISQAHEEECRASARRSQEAILPCGHHASSIVSADEGTAYCQMCELEGQLAQAQAQVAVMSEALRKLTTVSSVAYHEHHDGGLTDDTAANLRYWWKGAEEALSAVPKVLFHGRDIGSIPLSFGHERVDIYICSRHHEQPQESEQ